MKEVQPIRSMAVLEQCFQIARDHDKKMKKRSISWELLMIVGFNTSLRIDDMLSYKVRDLRGREYAQIKAKKTGKEARILINPAARREINRLTAEMNPNDYIFQSRQKDKYTKLHKAITRQRAWQIINTIARMAGIEERIGCHSTRKTFGYHYYKMSGDIGRLQRILGHSSRRDTLVYIGVIQDEIDESLKKFKLADGRSV